MDVTSSVEVGFQAKIGDPYVKEIPAVEINRLLKDIMSTGRYAGGAISISSGVVTIPAGTVLYIASTDQVVRVEVKTALTITVTATLDSVFMRLVVGVTGLITVTLEVAASFPAGDLVQIGTTSGGPPPDTITLATTLQKLSPKTVIVSTHIPDLVAAGSFWVPIPVDGLITKLSIVNDADTATGDATVTPEIGGTPVTGGLLTIADPTVAGVVTVATPTAAHAVTRGGVLELVVGGANTGAGGGTIVIEITQ